MTHHYTLPEEVWILPPGLDEEPHRLSPEEIGEIFNHYDDTGFEPKLEWLHKAIECSTIDFRNLPEMGHLWFDDEGLLKGSQINPLATILYQTVYDQENVIVGRAVLVVEPGVAAGEAERYVRETRKTLLHARAIKGAN